MIRKLFYLLGEGFKNVWKNFFMTFASISVLTACLIIIGSFYLITANINSFIQDIANENEIAVFIDESVPSDQAAQVEGELLKIENVKKVIFVPKDVAFEEYKKSMNVDISLFDGMENPLRDSYRVFLNDISQMHETMEELKGMPHIANVRGREDISQTLVKIKNILTIVMLWLFAILVFISVFIISNTIKLTMFARKKEISIMKYVGATNSFIRFPFVVEGIIIGVLGAGLAFLIQFYMYNYTMDMIFSEIQMVKILPFRQFKLQILIGFFLSSISLSMMGSYLSIRKYLNV